MLSVLYILIYLGVLFVLMSYVKTEKKTLPKAMSFILFLAAPVFTRIHGAGMDLSGLEWFDYMPDEDFAHGVIAPLIASVFVVFHHPPNGSQFWGTISLDGLYHFPFVSNLSFLHLFSILISGFLMWNFAKIPNLYANKVDLSKFLTFLKKIYTLISLYLLSYLTILVFLFYHFLFKEKSFDFLIGGPLMKNSIYSFLYIVAFLIVRFFLKKSPNKNRIGVFLLIAFFPLISVSHKCIITSIPKVKYRYATINPLAIGLVSNVYYLFDDDCQCGYLNKTNFDRDCNRGNVKATEMNLKIYSLVVFIVSIFVIPAYFFYKIRDSL